MVPLVSLAIPILLSAVLAFIASSVIHMATSFHKHDAKKLPDEEAARSALRSLNLTTGDYAMPSAHARIRLTSRAVRLTSLAKWP